MTLSEINVLVGRSNWAWREAVSSIFAPRGVNSIVAADAASAIDIIEERKIHTAIVDVDSAPSSGLSIVRVIRDYYPLLPCLLLSQSGEKKLLTSALELHVFSVIAKPVDMRILQEQLNRLFIKKYNSSVFDS
ncbi:MAG: response regulator [Planctomycetota bacterium]|jgi:DNA-binding NtrC family response regulator